MLQLQKFAEKKLVFCFQGEREKELSGCGCVAFENGDSMSGYFRKGQREGRFTITTSKVVLNAEFKNNLIQGFCSAVSLEDGSVTGRCVICNVAKIRLL